MKYIPKKYKVYLLRDKNKKIQYVGQTRQRLRSRYTNHKLRSWFRNEYFTIELVTDFDRPEPMYKLEAMLIIQYDTVENGWNRAYGHIECPEQFDSSGQNNAFYGHKHRKETCEKIGKRSVGNEYAKGNKSRTGYKNSEQHTKALVESRQRKVMCVETGDVFTSGRHAAEKMGLHRSKISNVCHGKRGSTGGFRFVFVDDDEKSS